MILIIFAKNHHNNIWKYTIDLQRKNSSDDKSEDDMDEDGLRESKTTVTIQLDPTDTTNFQRVRYFIQWLINK